MATVKIKGLATVRVKGVVYTYAWRGGPRLKNTPGTPEFLAELAAAQIDRKTGDANTVGGLIARFKAHPRWVGPHPQAYADSTKVNWAHSFDIIKTEFGALPVRFFNEANMRPAIVKWRDKFTATPATADRHLESLSVLLAFAMQEGLLLNNLCSGVRKIYKADRSEIIWTPEDLAAFQAEASPEVYRIAKLGSLCGFRSTDLFNVGWRHVNRKTRRLEYPTQKSGGKTITGVPLYGELAAYLETIPKRGLTILTNSDGEQWKSKSSFQNTRDATADAITKAGGDGEAFRKLRAHDLRGTAATRFAVAGFPARSIAYFMGWKEANVQALIDRYVNHEALVDADIARLDTVKTGA
jgi:integrase